MVGKKTVTKNVFILGILGIGSDIGKRWQRKNASTA